MFTKLSSLLKKSYAPYSKINVACIVVMSDKKIFNGVNIENSAYSATICAERSALANAISNSNNKENITHIYLLANTRQKLYPCGVCLQFMAEIVDSKCKITIYDQKQTKITTTLKKLFPHLVTSRSFGWK